MKDFKIKVGKPIDLEINRPSFSFFELNKLLHEVLYEEGLKYRYHPVFQTIEVSKVDSEMFYLKKGTLLLTPHNHYHGTTSLTNGTIGHLIYLDRHSELNFLDNKITYDNWVRFLLKQGVRVYWVTLNSPTEIEERLYPDVRNYPNFKVFSKYPSQVAAGIDEISKYVEGRRVRISIDTDFANSLNDLLDTLQYISSVLRYEIETIEVYFDPILFKEKSEIRRIVNFCSRWIKKAIELKYQHKRFI